jgi:capsular polysaccharide transport system permease protein
LLAEEVEVQTVKLVRLVPDGPGLEAPGEGDRTLALLRRRLPFLLLVVLPVLLSAVYFFLLAAPRYQSEVKFVVRTPSTAVASELASIVQGSSGVSRANDDAFIAKEYMLSRDAIQQLLVKVDLLGLFGKAGLDPWWRYPGFLRAPDAESLQKQYKRFVSVDYDSSSGISTLTAQGYEAADAQRLASALLDLTEVFLNGLNGRAQNDAVQNAVRDVTAAQQRAYAALDAVTSFRNRETVLDPTLSSTGIVQSISALSLELSSANARLAELLTNTPQSPEIATLRTRIAALQAQVAKQRQQLGGNSDSLAPRIATYQRLLLDQTFAEKAFTSALAALEAARMEASRQRIFLERVTAPDLPDAPAYPYRVASVLATLAGALACWRVVTAIFFDTQEHHKR